MSTLFTCNKTCYFTSILFFISLPLFSQPNIHFIEYRVLLTEDNPYHNYRIFNQGSSKAACKINFVDYLISDTGKLTLAKKGSKLNTSASGMLRASPKNVYIPPRASQKVKILARGLKQQIDGEWVSYFNLECKNAEPKLINGLNLIPNFVFHIPVVVRKGKLDAIVKITKAKLVKKEKYQIIELVLNRIGQRSLYGDISILDETGDEIGILKGLSHYQQTTDIPISITLKRPPKGKLTIKFEEQNRFGGDLTTSFELNQ
ncbi:hypothetical protein [Pseudoalteromonas denitrificans]|uniref:P pilus assembly protein, chaperone PapD n=1 Tax=Pseudoalteromonas denitrificans DSM 6059 TaxID=1123010 RepID=A0A1I1HX87_9GAMM|nr:hypothetical protein [Pseudoalteromonas denitrificans]SFC25570.1 hypothetical protein SAMN02745724_01279 [Pseudoalteromonas denitrificans DSM 6059]